ncbi:MAG: GAF domain-containing protein [Treponema sp.]|jgi:HD-GYP domain-containing protein (c-di-GMP phosphodiesterase class II)|nr:GAF domain-containing protein [Treponema sp.]
MADEMSNLGSLFRLDLAMNQIQDLDLLLERILREARRVVHADAGSIYVKETLGGKGRLAIKYAQNDTQQKKLPPGQKLIYSIFSIPINEQSLSGYCALTGRLVNVPDVYRIPRGAPYSYDSSYDMVSGYKTTSTLTVPLKTTEDKLLGVIQMINATDEAGNWGPFSKEDEALISDFAFNAAIVLQRAYMNRVMILRMIRLSELRDPKETGPHVNRVAGYAVEMYDRWAYHHKVPEQEREKFKDAFKIGAMFHDVGKVAISDLILKKPARFTSEEYDIMQRHTLYGADLFGDPQSSLDIIARDVALNHHENWDGSGYPGWLDPVSKEPIRNHQGKMLGKKGEEIPLTGRIVAIADVFDALCSKRVYKDPWSKEAALAEIHHLAGTKFDPELVEIFFEIFPHIEHVQDLYPESGIS